MGAWKMEMLIGMQTVGALHVKYQEDNEASIRNGHGSHLYAFLAKNLALFCVLKNLSKSKFEGDRAIFGREKLRMDWC